jgi:hypothetical protein
MSGIFEPSLAACEQVEMSVVVGGEGEMGHRVSEVEEGILIKN